MTNVEKVCRVKPAHNPAFFFILVVVAFLLNGQAKGNGVTDSTANLPEVRVGSEIEFFPYAFVDKNGQPAGFSIELIYAVSNAMGLKITISTGTWDKVWNGLAEGQLDVLPIVAKIPERTKFVDFSLPHTETFDAFFVRQGTPPIKNIMEAKGKEIVVMRSDAAHHELIGRNFQGHIVLVNTIPEGLLLISSGKHDAFLCSKLIGIMTVNKHKIKGLAAGPPIQDYKRVFSFAVKKGNTDLLEKLNQGLLIVKTNGEYNRIYEKWLSAEEPWKKFEKYIRPIGGAIIAIIFISGLWIVLLQLQIRKRKESEEQLMTLYSSMAEGLANHEIVYKNGNAIDYIITDVNPAFERITSITRSSALGKKATDLYQIQTPPYLEIYARVASGGGPEHFETFYPPMEKHFSISVFSPGKGKFATVFTDITERKLAEEKAQSLGDAIAREKDRLSALLDSIADEIWFADTAGKFTLVNPSGAQEFKIDTAESTDVRELAVSLEVLRPDKSPRPVEEAPPLRALRGEVVRNLEEIIRTPVSGELRYRQVSSSPVRDATRNIIGSISVVRDITSLKKAESALQESEEKYRTLVQYAPAGIYEVDFPSGRFTQVNDAMCRILGYTSDELLAMNAFDVLDDDGKARFSERIGKTQTGEKPEEDVEYRVRKKDGHLIWGLLNTTLRRKDGKIVGATVVAHDITARKRAEELFHLSELKYRRLFEAAKDGILILDFETGLIVDANPFLLDLLGFSSADLLTKHLWDLGIFKDIAASKEAYTELQNKEIIRYENLPLETKDGKKRSVEFVSNVYLVDDKKVIQCNIRDITERKMAEEDRERLLTELKQHAEQMALANQELEAFSYSVSHDLRNPLNAIITNTEVLAEEVGAKPGTDMHTAMTHITQSAKRMAHVITDLLTLSGISRRKIELQKVDLSEMAQEFFSELKASNPQREVQIKIQPELTLNADPGLLKILVENLLRNAWKFTSQRKVASIELGSLEKDGNQYYFIRDNGVGFDMKESDKLFKPYKRLHSTQEYKGTGIGLAIAKRVVEKHGGAIWAESEKEKGATFYFRFA